MPNKCNMTPDEFCDVYNIKYVPLNINIVNGKKEFDNDGIKMNTIFTKEFDKVREERIDNIEKYNTIAIDTSDYFQLDIDIYDKEEYDSLTQKEKELYDYFSISGLPKYSSLSKDYGFHIILPKQINKELWNGNTKMSDYDKYKKGKKEEYTYMNSSSGYIELLTGTWAWVKKDTLIEYDKTLFVGDKKNDILEKILKPKTNIGNSIKEVKDKPKKTKKKKKDKEIVNEILLDNTLEEEDISDSDKEYSHITKEYIDYLNNIDMKYINNYSDFYKLVYACANNEVLKETIQILGSHSNQAKADYETWFNKLWNNGINQKGNYTINFISSYSKSSNKTKHYQIYLEHQRKLNMDIRSKDLFNIWKKDNENNIVCVNTNDSSPEFWLYNQMKKLWVNISKNEYEVKHLISEDLEEFCKLKIIKLNNKLISYENEDEDGERPVYKAIEKEITKFENLYLKLGEEASLNKIWNIGKGVLSYIHYKRNDFDDKAYLFCFADRLYDFSTHTFRQIEQTDYITTKLPYNYFKVDKKETNKFVNNYLRNLVDPEVFDDLCFILASCLIGEKFQLFYVFNGSGSNGKSLLQTILKFLLGDGVYYESGGGDVATTSIQTDKPNPQLAKIHNKRVFILSEPKEDQPIAIDTIKRLSGDASLNVRKLHKEDAPCKLSITTILCCNQKPALSSFDNATERRIRDIYFPYEFKSKQEYDETNPLHKLASSEFKETNMDWLNKAKISLFDFLVDWIKDYEKKYDEKFYKCKEGYVFSDYTMKRSKQYCRDSDVFRNWFDSQYIKLDEEKYKDSLEGKNKIKKTSQIYLPCSTIHTAWKDSEDITKLNKTERNKDMKLKDFISKTLVKPVYKDITKSYNPVGIQLYMDDSSTRKKITHTLEYYIKKDVNCECLDKCSCIENLSELEYT